MGKYEIRLLWFNAWFGFLVTVGVLITHPLPLKYSFLLFFNYELYLQADNQKAVAPEAEVTFFDRGSRMKIETDKGVFYFHRTAFFDKATEKLETAEYIEIWYNEESRRVREIRVNQSDFVIRIEVLDYVFFLFFPIFIGLLLLSSIMVIIKTKGWGSDSLLKKYPEGLLKTIFGDKKF